MRCSPEMSWRHLSRSKQTRPGGSIAEARKCFCAPPPRLLASMSQRKARSLAIGSLVFSWIRIAESPLSGIATQAFRFLGAVSLCTGMISAIRQAMMLSSSQLPGASYWPGATKGSFGAAPAGRLLSSHGRKAVERMRGAIQVLLFVWEPRRGDCPSAQSPLRGLE
jgi:hypothetical protein